MLREPDARLAAEIAARALGRIPHEPRRFTTGASHFVFDLAFDDHPPAVVRIGRPSARDAMAGAAFLSRLLTPLGLRLPRILAEDLDATFPWLLLERLPGTDLGAVITGLSEDKLDLVAAEVAHAQAVVAKTATAGRYGYAARPEEAPHTVWSEVVEANLDRSHRRIAAAKLFDPGPIAVVRQWMASMQPRLDSVAATPFLHDTTTKNVIIAPDGGFSGIVDVDDLCFGDPRYPAALTLAVLLAYGGPTDYVAAWLRHAGQADDRLFRLYVTVFLLDLMGEHGHDFNGNQRPSTPAERETLSRALDDSLRHLIERLESTNGR